jgi:hypothetical protein
VSGFSLLLSLSISFKISTFIFSIYAAAALRLVLEGKKFERSTHSRILHMSCLDEDASGGYFGRVSFRQSLFVVFWSAFHRISDRETSA